jgi:hypothetical protein
MGKSTEVYITASRRTFKLSGRNTSGDIAGTFEFQYLPETWLSFADFLAHSGTPQCLQERERMEGIINNHKQFVHKNITQRNRRKEEIMLEMRSLRSNSGSRASSMSSTALRARAEVAAAIKKAELQKKRLLVES